MALSREELRQIAIVLNCLDTRTCDNILDQLPSEKQQIVRDELIELTDVSEADESEAIKIFFQRGNIEIVDETINEVKDANPAITFEPSQIYLEQQASESFEDLKEKSLTSNVVNNVEPFAFLEMAPMDDVIVVMMQEHPQTIAVILSKISKESASKFLQRFPVQLQSELVRRLSKIDMTPAGVVDDIAKIMVEKITVQITKSSDQLSVVQPEENESKSLTWGQIAPAEEGTSPPDTAEGLSDELELICDDVESIADQDLLTVLLELDEVIAHKALLSLDPSISKRILKLLPRRQSKSWKNAIENLGPVRISELDEAKIELLVVAHQLHAQNRILFPMTLAK